MSLILIGGTLIALALAAHLIYTRHALRKDVTEDGDGTVRQTQARSQ